MWSRCWREDGEKKGRPAVKTISLSRGEDFWMISGFSIISLFQSNPNFVCKKTSAERVDVPLGEKNSISSALDKVEMVKYSSTFEIVYMEGLES